MQVFCYVYLLNFLVPLSLSLWVVYPFYDEAVYEMILALKTIVNSGSQHRGAHHRTHGSHRCPTLQPVPPEVPATPRSTSGSQAAQHPNP